MTDMVSRPSLDMMYQRIITNTV